MHGYEIKVERTGAVIATSASLADTATRRMKGLLGRRALARGEALIIRPCWSVHTWFMLFAIDVVYLDKEDRVLKVVRSLRPWRFSAARRGHTTIEFQGGTLDDAALEAGDRLLITARSSPLDIAA